MSLLQLVAKVQIFPELAKLFSNYFAGKMQSMQLFIYSNTTGRFSVSHEQSQVLLELCRGEEKLERSSRFGLFKTCIIELLYIIIYNNLIYIHSIYQFLLKSLPYLPHQALIYKLAKTFLS